MMNNNLLTSLSLNIQRQIVGDPEVGRPALYGALPRVCRSLGAVAVEFYSRPLYVVLRSAAQASSFAQWIGKHGQHLSQLHVVIEGNWLSNRAWSATDADPGFGAWSSIWNNLKKAQSAGQPRLQAVVLRSPSSRAFGKVPGLVGSIVVSTLALIPQLSLIRLDLNGDLPVETNRVCGPDLPNRVLPALSNMASLQELQICCSLEGASGALQCLTSLTRLSKLVMGLPHVYPSDAPVLLHQLTLLKSLSLKIDDKVTGVLAESLGALTGLTSLTLTIQGSPQQSGAVLTSLTKLRNLVHLTFDGHATYLQQQLPHLTGLQSLTLATGSSLLDEDGIMPATSIQPLVHLTSLRLLEWAEFSAEMWGMLPHFKDLRSLALHTSGYFEVISAGLGIAQLGKLQGLTNLSLCYMGLQDECFLPSLSAFAAISGLKHLELLECSFDEEHVAVIAASVRDLSHLVLQPYESEEIGSAAISMLTLLTGLQQLQLSPKIKLLEEKEFLARFPQLARALKAHSDHRHGQEA